MCFCFVCFWCLLFSLFVPEVIPSRLTYFFCSSGGSLIYNIVICNVHIVTLLLAHENTFSLGSSMNFNLIDNISTCIQLHGEMCKELSVIYCKIVSIFPSLEAARPRSKSGIQALCSMHIALEKAKNVLRHCSECSKLYLVR
jgi:hypothetical protein